MTKSENGPPSASGKAATAASNQQPLPKIGVSSAAGHLEIKLDEDLRTNVGGFSMIRRIIFASVGVIALTSAASAADMYVPGPAGGPGGYKDDYVPAPWAGFYVGVNGGYGWGTPSSKVTDLEIIGGTIIAENSANFTPEGGFGGGQIGYNWQRGRFVYGVEADIQAANIHGDATTGLAPGISATGSTDLDWFGTVRGRLGYTCGSALFYGTAGFAFGGIQDKLSKVDGAGAGSVSKSETATGYVVGGGVEYAVSPKWSVKAEYQFIDLGKDHLSVDAVAPLVLAELDAEHSYNTVRVGINYHFLPSYEPLK